MLGPESAKEKAHLFVQYLEETFRRLQRQTADENVAEQRKSDKQEIKPITSSELQI